MSLSEATGLTRQRVGPTRWRERWRSARRLFLASPSAKVGVPIVLVVAASVAFATIISPADPFKQDLDSMLQPPFWGEGGSISRPLGTDLFGRDLLSRIILGGQVSLLVAVSAVLISGAIGIPMGLVSGYARGRTDEVIMAIVDVKLAFPSLLLMIMVVFMLGASLLNLMVALGVVGWVGFARLTRAEVLSVGTRPFVEAAKAIGCGRARIIIRHVLPQVMTPIVVVATLQLGGFILAEAGLSFLGMGIQPPTPSWGGMLAEGRDFLLSAWWYATFPGVAILITVLGFNLVGEWLREILNPRSRQANL